MAGANFCAIGIAPTSIRIGDGATRGCSERIVRGAGTDFGSIEVISATIGIRVIGAGRGGWSVVGSAGTSSGGRGVTSCISIRVYTTCSIATIGFSARTTVRSWK